MNASILRRGGLVALTAAAVVGLAACSSTPSSAPASSPAPSSTADASAGPTPRITLSYEGGIVVLDAETLEVEADLPSERFTRLNPAGDGRHVLVSMSEGFQVLDTGSWTDADGTSRTAEPVLTDLVFPAEAPGHVVRHAGKTVLYADGTSDTTIFDTADLLASSDELPATESVPGVEAHHGVSVVLEDGTLVTTVGNADGRTGIVARDADGTTIVESTDCPGVHGEGTAADEAVVFGCQDGALLFHDGEIVKLDAPDVSYGRMGNAYVSETSPIVVGDYNNDQDAEGYLLDDVALIDTRARTLRVIELPAGVEYTFRDVARGPDDLAYILATDGSIHVLDPETGDLVDAFPVIEAWEGPLEWQDAHPAIVVNGDIAYVTEPASNKIHAVDVRTGAVLASATLHIIPNEIAVAIG